VTQDCSLVYCDVGSHSCWLWYESRNVLLFFVNKRNLFTNKVVLAESKYSFLQLTMEYITLGYRPLVSHPLQFFILVSGVSL